LERMKKLNKTYSFVQRIAIAATAIDVALIAPKPR